MKTAEIRLSIDGPAASGKTLFLTRLKKLIQTQAGSPLRILSMRDAGEHTATIRHITCEDPTPKEESR